MTRLKFKFLLIFLAVVLLCWIWMQWSFTIPLALPQRSTINVDKGDSLLRGSYYEVSIPITGNQKYLSADYRLWIPDVMKTVRGVMVKQHGCGDPAKLTGLDHADDLQWQALASKHQFALLGTKLPDVYPMCTDAAGKDRVAERVFLRALTALAKDSNHPELNDVPWALWGHSGGADWVMQMLYHYPERVIAVTNTRCGGILFSSGESEILDLDPKSVSAMLSVPVLWTVGDRDPNVNECVVLTKKIFSKFRRAGSNWALAVEANTAHESGDTRFLAIPYLDAVLTARQANSTTSNSTNLSAIAPSQGWLGNIATHEIASVSQYQENPLEAAWLPNEETARKWQQYITMNTWNRLGHGLCKIAEKLFIFKVLQYPAENCYPVKILPTQKPAAPTNVHAVKIGEAEVALTWSFSPDLENGLPLFRIYRDNSLIKTFQGQGHDFGDAPEFPHVALEFRDKEVRNDALYAVSAFNVLGESVSQPTQLTRGT
jgi:hypothetical protein